MKSFGFGMIFSTEWGRIWTNVITHNIWNCLSLIRWWPRNLTSRSFSRLFSRSFKKNTFLNRPILTNGIIKTEHFEIHLRASYVQIKHQNLSNIVVLVSCFFLLLSPDTFDLSLYTPYGARYRVAYEVQRSFEL